MSSTCFVINGVTTASLTRWASTASNAIDLSGSMPVPLTVSLRTYHSTSSSSTTTRNNLNFDLNFKL